MLPMHGVQSLIPGWGTRSHMLQLRVLMLQLKDLKCCNQDPVQPNKYFKKEQKNDRSDLLNSVAWALLSHLTFQCRPHLLGGCVVHQLATVGIWRGPAFLEHGSPLPQLVFDPRALSSFFVVSLSADQAQPFRSASRHHEHLVHTV